MLTPFELVRGALFAGLGMQEKVKEFIQDLVKKGQMSESQGAKLLKEWTERADKTMEDLNETIATTVEKTLQRLNIPTHQDIEELQRKVKSLTQRVKKLEEALKASEAQTEEKE